MSVAPDTIVAVASSVPVLLSILASTRKYFAARTKKKVRITINGKTLEFENGNEKQAEILVHFLLAAQAADHENVASE